MERNPGRVLGRVLDEGEVRDAAVEVTLPTAKQVAAAIREIAGVLRADDGAATGRRAGSAWSASRAGCGYCSSPSSTSSARTEGRRPSPPRRVCALPDPETGGFATEGGALESVPSA